MKWKPIIDQLAPYKQGMQMEDVKKKYGLQQIVKLASNENPYGFSPKVPDVFQQQQQFALYPDGHATELRQVLAEKLHVEEDQLLFGSGTDEIVQMICRAFLYPNTNTVMAAPTFPQYKHHASIEGATVVEVPTNFEGYHNLQGMLEAIDEYTNVVWLCSPNNPTGTNIPPDDFDMFLEQCPKDTLIVLDEAYYEYLNEEKDIHAIIKLKCYNNLIILRTFSKAYGLASLRIGYAITSREIASKLNVVRAPFNTTSIAQKAAIAALSDDDFIQQTVSENRRVKTEFMLFLHKIGWRYYDSEANFLLVQTPVEGETVFAFLLKHGFIVRPGEGIGVANAIRVTIGKAHDMQKLQALLLQFNTTLKDG
ncbi:histidinol-phosphate transaminase [Virgibacillus sp. LDC-1]|uniref:histidinol-phosphate transaminase n=1 Tax=Virgibacillus sp. LDC-1 TaxID=3039856 RepID=UPI0024DE52A5|nr:histidinol-phosphate transaminase [Virgibacillus sp. LDC-1]